MPRYLGKAMLYPTYNVWETSQSYTQSFCYGFGLSIKDGFIQGQVTALTQSLTQFFGEFLRLSIVVLPTFHRTNNKFYKERSLLI